MHKIVSQENDFAFRPGTNEKKADEYSADRPTLFTLPNSRPKQ